jgi:hypothetical protein
MAVTFPITVSLERINKATNLPVKQYVRRCEYFCAITISILNSAVDQKQHLPIGEKVIVDGVDQSNCERQC